jgi:hypothetical protein
MVEATRHPAGSPAYRPRLAAWPSQPHGIRGFLVYGHRTEGVGSLFGFRLLGAFLF